MVKSATKHTTSISAMALAATSVSPFSLRSTLVTEVFSCKKSIEKTWLVGATNQAQNTWKLVEGVRNNVYKISLCLSRKGCGDGGMV